MSLPEHVVEEWARRALLRISLEEVRELIASAIETLERVAEDIETSSYEAIDILYGFVNYINSIPAEEIRGPEARRLASIIREALEYIAALTYVDAEGTVSDVLGEISDLFGDLLPYDEIIDAIVPEIQDNASEVAAGAEELAEIVDNIRSIFNNLQYEEQGLTDDEADELAKTIEEAIDELSAIHRLYLNIIKTVAEKLIEILKQLDEHLTRIASEE